MTSKKVFGFVHIEMMMASDRRCADVALSIL